MLMDDGNWKDQYKDWKQLKPFELKLLDDGAETLSQAWLLNAMWCDWKEIKKLKDTDLPALNTIRPDRAKDPWYE